MLRKNRTADVSQSNAAVFVSCLSPVLQGKSNESLSYGNNPALAGTILENVQRVYKHWNAGQE